MKMLHNILRGWVLVCIYCAVLGDTSLACSDPTKYKAAITEKDRRSSSGSWLDTPGSIVRQDRANFHKFSRRDLNDEGDNVLSEPDKRAELERAVDRAYPFDPDQATGSYNDLVEYMYNGDIDGAIIEVTFWHCKYPPRATVQTPPLVLPGGEKIKELEQVGGYNFSSPPPIKKRDIDLKQCTQQDTYYAIISDSDRYDVSGTRLTTVGSILQQDRANFHERDRRDGGDESDIYFDDPRKRLDLARAADEEVVKEVAIAATYDDGRGAEFYLRIINGGKVRIQIDFMYCKGEPILFLTDEPAPPELETLAPPPAP